jgi:predicted DCC family thiol-disulfide oxidoreductase YuxK
MHASGLFEYLTIELYNTPVAAMDQSRISRRILVTRPKLTVWYNTRCPVCNAGINRQKRRVIETVCSGAIEFRDINAEPFALSRFGADINDVRRRLHGVDPDGQLYVGADCAIEIWLRTPGDAWLGRVLGLPILRRITRFGYDRFADLLYAWNRSKGRW